MYFSDTNTKNHNRLSQHDDLLSIRDASAWASQFLNRDISPSNISYLIQYGKVKKYGENGTTRVSKTDLKQYYQIYTHERQIKWEGKLGNDLNWHLSFQELREKDTTKHVHRLHPYKGKFIPHLVAYFLDDHIDSFKKQVYFHPGDIILDPFSGSGTTLVQANELNMHSIGVDVSRFNCLISEVKLSKYDFTGLKNTIETLSNSVVAFEANNRTNAFEQALFEQLSEFNVTYFPTPKFKYKVNDRQIDEQQYGKKKEIQFLRIYDSLVEKYRIELKHKNPQTFLDTWYLENIRNEIEFTYKQINKIKEKVSRNALNIILSRTIRSCRATTHSDLATLKEPQTTTYYCFKHKKICKPIFSIKNMFSKYAVDTLKRLRLFSSIRSTADWQLFSDDSRTIDLEKDLKEKNPRLYNIYRKQKIRGIFTSPPYVGQIDYHEQHAYAYDLLQIGRKDDLEIGPLYSGQGTKAKKAYVDGIAGVLRNCKQYLAKNFDIFLVANDKYNLYPEIAVLSGMSIVNQYKRPVMNRTERDKSPYSEIIFHFKSK